MLVRICQAMLVVGALVLALTLRSAPAGAQTTVSSDNPQIDAALTLLAGSPSVGHLRQVLDDNQVDIHFLSMAPGIYARYNVVRHVIEIDDRWMDADVVTLAAVIAHEATHTQDAVSGYLASGGAGACIDSEIRAFRNSSLFWVEQYGAAGKPGALTELDTQLNSVADRELRDPSGLESLVRQTYSQQCGQ